MRNRSGNLKWQESCRAKGQLRWGLERHLGGAEICEVGICWGVCGPGEWATDARGRAGLYPGVMGAPRGLRKEDRCEEPHVAGWFGAGQGTGMPGGCRNHKLLLPSQLPAACPAGQAHPSLPSSRTSTPSDP